MKAFCEPLNINPKYFSLRRTKLGYKAKFSAVPDDFVQVLPFEAQNCSVTVKHISGLSIEFSTLPPVEYLQSLAISFRWYTLATCRCIFTEKLLIFARPSMAWAWLLKIRWINQYLPVVCNKKRDKLKILYWDKTGFCLWHKRLEQDKFMWPRKESAQVIHWNKEQLDWLLRGFNVIQITAHKPLKYNAI